MNGDNESGEEQQPSEGHPHQVLLTDAVESITLHPNRYHQAKEWANQQIHSIKWKEIAGVLTLLIASAAAYIYWSQLQVMQRQLTEIQSSSSLTSQLIVNAAHQASATTSLAQEAKFSNDDARERFRTEQRPYVVGIEAFLNPLVEGESGIRIHLSNSGRTPALEVAIYPVLHVFTQDLRPSGGQLNSSPVIPSGGTTESFMIFGNVSKDELERISNGKMKVSIEGRVIYRDVFKDRHESTFCFLYDAKEKHFKYCDKGNDIKY